MEAQMDAEYVQQDNQASSPVPMPLVTLSIDVLKINKDRLKQHHNGAKYCSLVLIPTPNNQYGSDWMVKESTTKEEREEGLELPILGNAKVKQPASGEPVAVGQASDNDDVPF